MKTNIILYLSIIFTLFCLQFDYLVTRCMEKMYGEIFYIRLEANIMVQQTHNINMILLPFFILISLYILYQIICFKLSKSYCIIDLFFIAEFVLLATCHLYGGLSWFLNGWF